VFPGERRCSPWGNVEARVKTFSPMSEFRRVKDLLADERVQVS